MKIVLISRITAWHRAGGMPHVFNDRAEALLREGHDVHIVTTSGATNIPHYYTTHILDTKSGGLWTLAFSELCNRVCQQVNPDIIHLDSFDIHNPFWVHYHPSKVAITMHGFGMGAALTSWNLYRLGHNTQPTINWNGMRAEAEMLAKAGTVIAISRWEYRMLTDMYGLRNVELVYNPIASYFFQPTTLQPGTDRSRFIMVYTSQSGSRGVEVAQRAANKANVRLEVISGMSRTCLPRIYDTAKAIVLPTCFAQGYDLTIAEGRARGCPAIMYGTGSYYGEAREWDVLVPPGDFEGLADAMKKLNDNQGPCVSAEAADMHRPEFHAAQWLNAITS